MKVFDRYVLRHLTVATLFVSMTLAVVVFLTQSLRFLELVINSGASSLSFWILTLLTMPRFFEIILPLSLMASTVFIYNRMAMDSELTAIRSVGYSPFSLAKPALILAGVVTIFLWSITMYVAPKSLTSMHEMRQIIKASFSALLFREGVFNQVGRGLTVYMRERTDEGDLLGLMIHDGREDVKNPATVLAKRGVIVASEEGHRVVVYDGFRHEYDRETGTLHRLNFERYTIDLPENGPVRTRWREPDERTITELLNPDVTRTLDEKLRREFINEIHRRIASPLLAMLFTVISCCALLVGPMDRRGQGRRIAMAIALVVLIEGLFMATFSLSRQSALGLPLMYLLILGPMAFSFFILSARGDGFRRRFFYGSGRTA